MLIIFLFIISVLANELNKECFELKDDIAHRLFDHITYNKKKNTLEIVYK